jgi:FKBP-type peptidyl-prolyl cis-trans isomerase
MAYLNGHSLTVWKQGDRLLSTDLNHNFGVLADLVERAMAQALQPDAAAVGLEMRLGRLEERVAALEHLTAMHARQRNEREYAPLSSMGAVLVLVNEATRKTEQVIARLTELLADRAIEYENFNRRLHRVEQQPDSATQEDFAALAADHKRLALTEDMLLAQVSGLRHELIYTRRIAEGKDREANRKDYAPMAYFGHLMQRIKELEARLP